MLCTYHWRIVGHRIQTLHHRPRVNRAPGHRSVCVCECVCMHVCVCVCVCCVHDEAKHILVLFLAAQQPYGQQNACGVWLCAWTSKSNLRAFPGSTALLIMESLGKNVRAHCKYVRAVRPTRAPVNGGLGMYAYIQIGIFTEQKVSCVHKFPVDLPHTNYKVFCVQCKKQ